MSLCFPNLCIYVVHINDWWMYTNGVGNRTEWYLLATKTSIAIPNSRFLKLWVDKVFGPLCISMICPIFLRWVHWGNTTDCDTQLMEKCTPVHAMMRPTNSWNFTRSSMRMSFKFPPLTFYEDLMWEFHIPTSLLFKLCRPSPAHHLQTHYISRNEWDTHHGICCGYCILLPLIRCFIETSR